LSCHYRSNGCQINHNLEQIKGNKKTAIFRMHSSLEGIARVANSDFTFTGTIVSSPRFSREERTGQSTIPATLISWMLKWAEQQVRRCVTGGYGMVFLTTPARSEHCVCGLNDAFLL
jgi:hypothetical protein